MSNLKLKYTLDVLFSFKGSSSMKMKLYETICNLDEKIESLKCSSKTKNHLIIVELNAVLF
jgi:hypothetical protein